MEPVPSASWAAIEGGHGPPLVLIHGYPLDHSMWKAQLAESRRAHRLAPLDLPGYGLARESPVPDSLRGFSEAVARAISARFDGPVAVSGHSFGGYVALQLYRDHPELINGLVLANTRSSADTEDARRTRLATAARLANPNERLDTDAVAEKLLAPGNWARGGPLVREVRDMVGRARSSAVIPTLKAIAGRPDLTPVLPEISVPTLVIWGEEDQLIPPEQTRPMVALTPHCVGVGIPGAGHLPALEAPEPFGQALHDLLARVERAAVR